MMSMHVCMNQQGEYRVGEVWEPVMEEVAVKVYNKVKKWKYHEKENDGISDLVMC